jgi:hypothetical protein
VRLVLAALFAVYVAVVAAMPHGHGQAHGAAHDRHECIACTTAGSLAWEPDVPDVAPRMLPLEQSVATPESVPSSGAPLGAIPGQSPPVA